MSKPRKQAERKLTSLKTRSLDHDKGGKASSGVIRGGGIRRPALRGINLENTMISG